MNLKLLLNSCWIRVIISRLFSKAHEKLSSIDANANLYIFIIVGQEILLITFSLMVSYSPLLPVLPLRCSSLVITSSVTNFDVCSFRGLSVPFVLFIIMSLLSHYHVKSPPLYFLLQLSIKSSFCHQVSLPGSTIL